MTDDRDRILGIIRARCGDVLSDRDINALMEPDLPTEIGEAILAIINLMTDRLNELAALVGAKEDDDDARQRPTLRKAAALS